MRVINQALRDVMGPGGSANDRASAYAFLNGSPMLHHWCAVAALNPLRTAARMGRLLAWRQPVPRASAGGRERPRARRPR